MIKAWVPVDTKLGVGKSEKMMRWPQTRGRARATNYTLLFFNFSH